jgi:hypothetical protein
MKSPPKEKRGCNTALKTAELTVAYRLLAFLQASKRPPVTRRCVSCDSRVTNANLGGHSEGSALSGLLWCDRCADFPQQLLLNLGGRML